MLQSSHTIDNVDREMLQILQEQGRISNAELARKVNLSPPAVHARLKRLETLGYIREYAAMLDREKIGYDLLCFVHVSLLAHQHEHIVRFREATLKMPEVLECHHITGEYDYLLKVVIRNRSDLERFVVNQLTPLPGVARLHTSLVLSEVKSSTVMPIPA